MGIYMCVYVECAKSRNDTVDTSKVDPPPRRRDGDSPVMSVAHGDCR